MSLDGTIGFIGAGNMAEALIRGLLAGKLVRPDQIAASDPRDERLEALRNSYGITVTAKNAHVAAQSRVLIMAVKPPLIASVLGDVAAELSTGALVISVAAGIPLRVLEAVVPDGVQVVRAMPNTPATVGVGATALAGGASATAESIAIATAVFRSVGIAEVVDEDALDAITGLSGSGPAYLFLVVEALIDSGADLGLDRDMALRLVTQTVLGAATLLAETGTDPAELRRRVTSPGGTTEAGVRVLEDAGLRAIVGSAVRAAVERAGEIGRST